MDQLVSRSVSAITFIDAPNLSIKVGNVSFAYRELGPDAAVPIVLLNHWAAVLDNFDPRIMDGLASRHRVIAIDYQGIGASTGRAPDTIEAMASDVVALVQALGYSKIDLLGFSLGGFVAQQVVLQAPELVRKLILTGTGPAGGEGIDRVGAVSWPLMLRGLLTLRDPKYYLFFTPSRQSRMAAKAYLLRLKQRTTDRDKPATPIALLRQLKAIKSWGRQAPQNLSQVGVPVLIVNGDNDIMVPTRLSQDMAARLPNAQLVIFEDAGHGGIFQYHAEFVSKVLAFLDGSGSQAVQ